MNIAVTGSRTGVDYTTVWEKLDEYASGDHHYVLGGAIGVDFYALQWVLRNDKPHTVYVPVDIAYQIKDPTKEEYQQNEVLLNMERCHVVELGYPKEWRSFHRRNLAMLEHPAHLLLSFDSSEYKRLLFRQARAKYQNFSAEPEACRKEAYYFLEGTYRSVKGGTWHCTKQALRLGIEVVSVVPKS